MPAQVYGIGGKYPEKHIAQASTAEELEEALQTAEKGGCTAVSIHGDCAGATWSGEASFDQARKLF